MFYGSVMWFTSWEGLLDASSPSDELINNLTLLFSFTEGKADVLWIHRDDKSLYRKIQ